MLAEIQPIEKLNLHSF